MDPRYSAQDVQRCEICDFTEVEMYCMSCPRHLCKKCVGIHLSDEPHKHQIVKYQDRKITHVLPRCITHSQERCENYCQDCERPVCPSCIASGEHQRHTLPTIFQIFKTQKERIAVDTEELEQTICPCYENIVQQIESDLNKLENRYKSLDEELDRQGDKWHEEINLIVSTQKEEIDEMKKKQLGALNDHLLKMKQLLTEVEESINSNKETLDSFEICMSLSYRSKNTALRGLPPKIHVSVPRILSQPIKKEQLSDMFGCITGFSIKTQEHGYSPKTRSGSPVSANEHVHVSEEDATVKKELVLEPETASITETGLRDLESVACQNDDEIWIAGCGSSLKLVKTSLPSYISRLSFGAVGSSVVREVKTNQGEKFVAVTKTGELIYCDGSTSVKIIRDDSVEELIKQHGWKLVNICTTVFDDLLVAMVNDDRRQAKVVRFTASSEVKQTIEFDDEHKPLYSSDKITITKYITENQNQDICVSDCGASAVVVTKKDGKLKFRYTGRTIPQKDLKFEPMGVATDSQCHILVADSTNDCIHILDINGQFLGYLSNICCSPAGLALDAADNLYVAEKFSGKVKKIRYLRDL